MCIRRWRRYTLLCQPRSNSRLRTPDSVRTCADVSVPEVAVQRMKLDERRIDALIEGIKQVADSEDPLGKTLSRTEICEVLPMHSLHVIIARGL